MTAKWKEQGALHGALECGRVDWTSVRRVVSAMDALTSLFQRFASADPEQAVIDELRDSWLAGEWVVLPVYPRGHVQIAEHGPWQLDALQFVAAAALGLFAMRTTVRTIGPAIWRAARGLERSASDPKKQMDWTRFGDVLHCFLLHSAMTAYAFGPLGAEVAGWFANPAEWWAFSQPALSASLRAYYLFQMGIMCEACVSMLRNVSTGRSRDAPMIVHHAVTLCVLLSAYRFGFVRVGAAVLILHDATDLPIDGIRIAQAIEWPKLLYISAISSIVSWSYFRAYCFPAYIISSAVWQV